ncbi:MAG: TerB family tellurite resistance protein [candidate division Zixibacteria bacterium]|nr:TerB family tellurite resistance protein [candidate division Zixibacteria bacterium]
MGFLDTLLGATTETSQDKAASEYDLQIATTALMIEMANIDDEFSDDERQVIVKTLTGRFQISEDKVDKIISEAEKEVNRQLDMYYFTNMINEHFAKPEKIKIIELVWQVVYSDDHLNGHEDYLVHRFAKLLRLDHKDLIDAKLKVKAEVTKK